MKRSINIGLFPRKNNGVLADILPIRIRVTYNGNRVDLRLGYSIEPEKWNSEEARVINNCRNRFGQTSGSINKAIDKCLDEIESIFVRYEHIEKRAPTPKEFKEAFDEAMGRIKIEEDKSNSFYSVYDEFTSTMGIQNNWTNATYTKFSSLKVHLNKYDKEMPLEELKQEHLQGLVQSMQASGLRNTTIAKYLSFLRWFLRWAYQKDYYKGNLHDTFKPKLKGTDGNAKEIIYLEWEELMHLYSFKFSSSKPSLPAIRDVFCFCCFTGLRYSDVAKLRNSDVKDGYIKIVTQKTVDGLAIELNKYSKAILAKYKDAQLPNDLALPVISNVKMNERLKTMGEVVGFDEPQRIVYFKGNERFEKVLPKYALLTTHCGRRTFIVNGLRLGVPAEVIMSWTGHSNYEAMKPYIKIVDPLKVSEMEKFDSFNNIEEGQENGKTQKGTQ